MRASALVSALLCSAWLAGQSSWAELPSEHAWIKRTEEAADRGLAFLARTQAAGGYWTGYVGHKRGDDYLLLGSAGPQPPGGPAHIGLTSLAALAFLAKGHLPGRGPYGDPVNRALNYVLEHVEENGYITDGGTRIYSHAFATLFLAQVYGMAGESRIKLALERAVHWIVDCQNGYGGWRYNAFDREPDLSVTVCQLQALRAARDIGIRVPKATIDRAVDYVSRSRTPRGRSAGLYYYKIVGRGAYEKNRDYAINAAALTSLFSAGVRDAELIDPTLSFLEDEYPRLVYSGYRRHYYYWYGNYYAAQAFFQAGGDRFRRYYQRICRDLVDDQQADGSWINDVGPGDAFSTAVACILLLLEHQYLPIFQR